MRITDATLRLVQALIDAEAVLDSIPSDEDSNFLPLSRTEQSAQGERCGCGNGCGGGDPEPDQSIGPPDCRNHPELCQ